MPVTHPLIAWLVEHAAFVRLTGVIGQGGKIAYHKFRGIEHNLRLPSLVKESGTKAGRKKAASLAREPGGAT